MTQIVSYLRNPLTRYCIIMPQNQILRFNQWFLNTQKGRSLRHALFIDEKSYFLDFFALTASFSFLLLLKAAALEAGILMVCFVRGFLPVLALR